MTIVNDISGFDSLPICQLSIRLKRVKCILSPVQKQDIWARAAATAAEISLLAAMTDLRRCRYRPVEVAAPHSRNDRLQQSKVM